MTEQFDDTAIDNQRIEEICDVKREHNLSELDHRADAIGVHDGCDAAEYTDRRDVHDLRDDQDGNLIDGIDDVNKGLCFFADGQAGEPDNNGEHQNLQHVAVCECRNGIGGDQVLQRVHQSSEGRCFDVCICCRDDRTLTEVKEFGKVTLATAPISL